MKRNRRRPRADLVSWEAEGLYSARLASSSLTRTPSEGRNPMAPHVVAPLPAEPRPRPARAPRLGSLTPRLSVVVVNYLHWEETAALVRQLRESTALRRGDVEVIVVDNHSPPHPQQRRLRRLS